MPAPLTGKCRPAECSAGLGYLANPPGFTARPQVCQHLPRGAQLVIGFEFCERDGFYTMVSLLALFLSAARATGGFGWDGAAALTLLDVYSGLGAVAQSNGANAGNFQKQIGDTKMNTITTKDGVTIFFKDWGKGQPIVFSHGWPLSSDDWDAQMMFFLSHGYRVVAHDRRGHGRSTQTADGHDMDHYADDLAAVTAHLDLKKAIHVGHSTGGGEVVHYIARHGANRVAKAVLISAVPPLMVKTPGNPGGLPKEVFDGFQKQVATNRAQIYPDVPTGPFYGFNRPGAKASQGIIQNWWRQGMMGGAKAHYDGVVAFSQTDFTEDLKKITVPALVMHGDDDQIVPYADSGPLSAKLVN